MSETTPIERQDRSRIEALHALRDRGVEDAESLLEAASVDRIMATCKWADRQGASTRLLVWKVKHGGVDPADLAVKGKRQRMQERFAEIAQRYPVGWIAEPHRQLQRRRGYDEDCDGMLIVVEPPQFPTVVVRCDACAYEAAFPVLSDGGRTA